MATWSYRFAILFFNNIYLASSGLSFVSQDICCIMWDLLLWHMDSLVVAHRLSSWDAWAWLLHSLWDLSSLTRGWTHISCIARQILNHWKVKVLVAQSCPTLYYPIYYSPSCSSVHGVLQARLLEWVAISFSRASSQPRVWTQVSCIAGRFFTIWATRQGPCQKTPWSQFTPGFTPRTQELEMLNKAASWI